MGTAYAVWGGIGAVGTVIVGMAWFDEPASTSRLLLILAIVGCIAALKLIAGLIAEMHARALSRPCAEYDDRLFSPQSIEKPSGHLRFI